MDGKDWYCCFILQLLNSSKTWHDNADSHAFNKASAQWLDYNIEQQKNIMYILNLKGPASKKRSHIFSNSMCMYVGGDKRRSVVVQSKVVRAGDGDGDEVEDGDGDVEMKMKMWRWRWRSDVQWGFE